MKINNIPNFTHMIGVNSEIFKVTILEIGAWNMDANVNKYVNNNDDFDRNHIVGYQAKIIDDLKSNLEDLQFPDTISPENQGQIIFHYGTNRFQLQRYTAGHFDNIAYDDAVMNRGYILVFLDDTKTFPTQKKE